VFKIGAIGDVLMCTPFIRQLRSNHPNSVINVLVGEYSKVVLRYNINVDNVFGFDEEVFVKKNVVEWLKLVLKVRKEKYDVVYVLDKHWAFNVTAWLFGIKKRVGFDRKGKEGFLLTKKVRFEELRHDIHYYLDLLKINNLRVDYDDTGMDLFPTKEDELIVKDFIEKNDLTKFVGLVPGGGNCMDPYGWIRIMPASFYCNIINGFNEKFNTNTTVVLFGSGDDKFYGDKIKKCARFKIVDSIGELSLQQSYLLMKKAIRILTNDCGGMHLAFASKTYTIGFFVITHPKTKGGFSNAYNYHIRPEYYNRDAELYGNYKYYKKYYDKEEE